MDAKKIALLVIALIIAGGTAFMARTMFNQASAPPVNAAAMPKDVGPQILVATRALPVGTIIEPDSFRYQPWPKELIENAYYMKDDDSDPSVLAGTVVRAPITAGQPLTQGALVKPGDRGFLAAALGPGMRAVTVSVSQQSGVAGFVFPGDRIDMVLTQQVSGNYGYGYWNGQALKASETIVRNVRVLATDQRTTSEDEEGKKQVQPFATVTLEVTPRIAEKIAVAQAIGQLSLSLRSIADNTAELEQAIASGAIKVPEGVDPKAEKKMLLQVASRPIDVDPTFTTGGDVSRFQRKKLPDLEKVVRDYNSLPYELRNRTGGGNSGGGSSEKPAPRGPVVKITRGNNTTEVTLGGK